MQNLCLNVHCKGLHKKPHDTLIGHEAFPLGGRGRGISGSLLPSLCPPPPGRATECRNREKAVPGQQDSRLFPNNYLS